MRIAFNPHLITISMFTIWPSISGCSYITI